jgi:hypothetical protein
MKRVTSDWATNRSFCLISSGQKQTASDLVHGSRKRARLSTLADAVSSSSPTVADDDLSDEALLSVSEVQSVLDDMLNKFPWKHYPLAVPFVPVHFLYSLFVNASQVDHEVDQLIETKQYAKLRIPAMRDELVLIRLDTWFQHLNRVPQISPLLIDSIRSNLVIHPPCSYTFTFREPVSDTLIQSLLQQGFLYRHFDHSKTVVFCMNVPGAGSFAKDLGKARSAIATLFKRAISTEVPLQFILEKKRVGGTPIPVQWLVWDGVGSQRIECIHGPAGISCSYIPTS